jgi:hypothetical protein
METHLTQFPQKFGVFFAKPGFLNYNICFAHRSTSLIQPIGQSIIATFKAYYIRKTFQSIFEKLDADSAFTLTMVWKSFTILNCVEIVAAAKNVARKSTLTGSWRNIKPSVHNMCAPWC